MSATIAINDATFEQEVLKTALPVLVDFWAPWCGPCRVVGPMVDELAEQYADRIKVAKLNVDQSIGIASQYNIRSIPTLMVFKDGEPVESFTGVVPKSKLSGALDQHL
jgi:thioredoxin 1